MTNQLIDAYTAASSRLLLFDYDGVLTTVNDHPETASPADAVKQMLRTLAERPGSKVAVVSGRDQDALEKWLGDLPIDMSAEHGHFSRFDGEWRMNDHADMSWRSDVETVMHQLVAEYPGSHVESKHASLVWHYRLVDGTVDAHAVEYRISQAAHDRAIVMAGKRAIDVRALGASKGRAVRHWYDEQEWDFVLCIGDDVTDESMFAALPEPVWTIKVGQGPTAARLQLDDQPDVVELLRRLVSSAE